MSETVSRRRALKDLAAAGAAAAFSPMVIRGQSAPIRVAGMPVEIAVASISPVTVRITVTAIVGAGGVPEDGALVGAAEGKAACPAADCRGVHGRARGKPLGALHRRSSGDPRRHHQRTTGPAP